MSMYVIHLTPKPFRVDPERTRWKLQFILDGPGNTKERQLMWAAMVMNGIQDHREPSFVFVRQKLAVFADKPSARKFAKKHENEYWHATVREVRLMPNQS